MNSGLSGNFNLSDVFTFIRNVWIWVYNSLSNITFQVGNFDVSLIGFAIALLVMNISITILFNVIRASSDNFVKTSNKKEMKKDNEKST